MAMTVLYRPNDLPHRRPNKSGPKSGGMQFRDYFKQILVNEFKNKI
jgi:hypothetical protein